jgi:beta-glucosidase
MVFPTPTGLAATWSPELVRQMADVIRVQMKRLGVRQALSPNFDIALDPRWGRVHETYGEDPYLVAALGVAYTRGLQGDDLADGVVATAKHFLGYGQPEGGINLSAYDGGARRTRDLYAFPFEAAIQLAGLGSVMNSYADVDGVPAAASKEVLTDLLRDTLGFTGFVSSDYSTHGHLVDRQRAAATPGEAARLTLEAGFDTEFPTPYAYGEPLIQEIENGRLDVSYLNASVTRILETKFRLGLFENPYPAERIEVAAIAEEGEDLSRELARRSIVLLENDGILPIDDLAVKKIALIGPHADDVMRQFATYSYPAFREMTVQMSSGAMGNMVGIDPGMAEWNNTLIGQTPVDDYVRDNLSATSLADEIGARAASISVVRGSALTQPIEGGIAEAVAAARDADLVLFALGGASLWFNGERTEAEGSDSADISLPDAQTRLVEAVASTGADFVTVLVQGRAYALPEVLNRSRAMLIAPYAGPFGPAAVAEIIAGEIEPSGRLPYSIPRHTGQIPVYHHQKAGTGYRNPLPPAATELYLDMPATPAYTFGQGLGYTTFAVSALAADGALDTAGRIRIAATITNTGERSGTAVPQLYLRHNTSGVTRPAQQLGGFARVHIDAGSSARVEFTIDATQLAYTDIARNLAVEAAPLDVYVGFSADDRQAATTIRMTGAARVITSSERTFFSSVEISKG